jgi:hypothetical protein
MSICLLLAFALAAWGQTGPPVQILRGELIVWQVRGLAGEMALRSADGRVHNCRVLPDTYLTRQTMRITPVGVKMGDAVEVVADFSDGGERCTAVTVYVRPPEPKPRRARGIGRALPFPAWQPRNLMDNLIPRGRLTYAGIVVRMDKQRLIVRTRKDGEKSFALREDTIFSEAGREVEPAALAVHRTVYLRASQTFDGDLEVYQVVWGDILQPSR